MPMATAVWLVENTSLTFDQIAKYNFNLQAKYLFVTNGLNHYCCQINYKDGGVKYLKEIPEFTDRN